MRRIAIACLFIVVLGYLATGVTLVRSDERAVVRRFGRILEHGSERSVGPGLFIGLPWGMDRVNRVSVRDRTVTVGWVDKEAEESASLTPGQLLTGDHNLVNVQAVIRYRVIESEVDKYVLLEDRIEPLLARAAEAALAQWLAGHDVEDAILHGKRRLPAWLTTSVQQRIKAYQLGVRVDGADIMLVDPPSAVIKYFNAVGQEHIRIGTRRDQADKEKKRKEKKAEEDEHRLTSQARAYAEEEESAAQADAMTFEKRLGQYKELTAGNSNYLNYLWLEEITRVYTQMHLSGRLDVLDHYLGADGINITQFPLQKKKP